MNDRIEKQIELYVPVSRVWRAITDHEEFGQWFRVKLNAPFVEGEEAVGQITHAGYEHLTWKATVQAIVPEKRFSFTWNPYGADAIGEDAKELPTLVEFRLEPTARGTLLTLLEFGFDHLPADRRVDAFRRNDAGWSLQMKNIESHVRRRA